MRRFFLPPEALVTDQVDLPQEVRQHLQVLRLKPGEQIELLDGQGLSCHCELLEVDRKTARAKVIKRRQLDQTGPGITLYQGLPKGDKLELILQKGTELGVSRFCPAICQRSQNTGRRTSDQRFERWNKVVREASRQSNRSHLPHIEPQAPLAEQLEECTSELRLTLWEEASRPLADVLPSTAPQSIALLIGPEGGLAATEVELAAEHGFIPVSLGPRILRTETAGFAVAGILQYLYGDLGRIQAPMQTTECHMQ